MSKLDTHFYHPPSSKWISRHWLHDDITWSMRLPNGSFKQYKTDQIGSYWSFYGFQYILPKKWRHISVVDDYGDFVNFYEIKSRYGQLFTLYPKNLTIRPELYYNEYD